MEKPEASTNQVLVRVAALSILLEWCNDAIDFADETDEQAAKAFEEVRSDANLVSPRR